MESAAPHTDLLRMARVCAIGEMSATLLHELNQPLTALLLYARTLQRALDKRADLPPDLAALAQKVGVETERAADIVARMQAFVDQRAPAQRRVDVEPLVEDAVRLTQMGSRPVVPVARAMTPDLPQVDVDPVQIQQVLVSLLRHALAAVQGRERPDVRIAAALEAGAVTLHVANNGPGIPLEDLPQLFTIPATSNTAGGAFELAMSKAIAQNHGGDLTVDPGGRGRGACFTLHLPIAAARA